MYGLSWSGMLLYMKAKINFQNVFCNTFFPNSKLIWGDEADSDRRAIVWSSSLLTKHFPCGSIIQVLPL
jgi:hypothetical protein